MFVMPHRRAHQKEPLRLCALVEVVQEGGDRQASPRVLVSPLKEVLHDPKRRGALEAGAEQRGLGGHQLDLRPLLADLLDLGVAAMVRGPVLAALVLHRGAPLGLHRVALGCEIVLHRSHAEGREEPRRGWGPPEPIPDPLHGVGRELGGGVVGGDLPEGRGRDHGGPLAAGCEIVQGVHAALVATNDNEVVAGKLLPAADTRVVSAELCAGKEWVLLFGPRVLELSGGPHDVPRGQDFSLRLLPHPLPVLAHLGGARLHLETRYLAQTQLPQRLDGVDLGLKPDVELALGRELVQVVRVLLAIWVLRL
mmetsp:Transcript_10259/g.31335  ORF Transcript_10259/g.31335 Transcript_10259/m.31335 type:complete len:309 (+) Transcript_10259:216-1142(+)